MNQSPMAQFEQDDVLDAIDWNVDASTASTHALAAELDLDLGWLHEPSPSALAHAAAAGAEVGATIDLDLMPSRSAPVAGAFGVDFDYDIHLALLAPTESVHAVLFYDDELVRVREVARFVCEGLRAGEHIFLVLTPSIAKAVRAALPADLLAAAERADSITIADAESVLDLLISDGMLDHAAFDEHVAARMRRFQSERQEVFVYGEAVTLLWAAGNVVAALELEHLWNELQKTIPFNVLCSYPRTLVADSSEDFTRVSACHTEVHAI